MPIPSKTWRTSLRTKFFFGSALFFALFCLGSLFTVSSVQELRRLSGTTPRFVSILNELNVSSILLERIELQIDDLYVANYQEKRTALLEGLERMKRANAAVVGHAKFLDISEPSIIEVESARLFFLIPALLETNFFGEGVNELTADVYAEIRAVREVNERFLGEIRDAATAVAAERERILNRLTLQLLLIGSAMLLALVALLLFLTRALMAPLRKIMIAADNLRRGAYGRKTGVRTDDEMGQLAAILDEASVSLEQKAAIVLEREKAEKRIKEMNVLRTKFIGIIAHQLRTPLNVIRWNLEEILSAKLGKLAAPQREFLRISYEADVEIINRIHDLLTAMDIEEGRVRLAREETSPETLLNAVLADSRRACALKEIGCAYVAPERPLPIASLDAEKIRQVFKSLMDNAVNYTKNGGAIKAQLAQVGRRIRFTVADTGVGIPKGEQALIFTRFYRASNASVMKQDASGLGLSIAKHYVELHGGTIGFTSKEGKGSTFWFELPIS